MSPRDRGNAKTRAAGRIAIYVALLGLATGAGGTAATMAAFNDQASAAVQAEVGTVGVDVSDGQSGGAVTMGFDVGPDAPARDELVVENVGSLPAKIDLVFGGGTAAMRDHLDVVVTVDGVDTPYRFEAFTYTLPGVVAPGSKKTVTVTVSGRGTMPPSLWNTQHSVAVTVRAAVA